jgi:phosphotransacetylase
VHPVDETSLVGAVFAATENLIIPILVGPESRIRQKADELKLDISPYTIISTEHSHASAERAVQMARMGEVEALMKGNLHTDELLSFVVDRASGLRGNRRMSHVFAVQAPDYPKPIFLTDAALNIKPNLETKKDIVQNAVDLFTRIGHGIPKVAIVSAVETVTEKIPSTLDATALCKMAERGQITGAVVDGPLGFDNAVSKESADIKGIVSDVAGNADIIIVPDIESGNMLYKQMTVMSGMDSAGIVLGAKVPIILTSRSSNKMSRKASSALALLYCRNQGKF